MSIHIAAMEIGYENPKGITYGDLKSKLETHLGYTIEKGTELAFLKWFIRNFSSTDIDHQMMNLDEYNRIKEEIVFNKPPPGISKYKSILNETFYIKGETNKQYLDYLELKEARESSRKAFYFSRWSIGLAIFSIIIALITTLVSYFTVMDVNIKSDETIIDLRTRKINEKNTLIDSLKNELYEADLLIRIYEDDGFKVNKKNE